MEKLPNTLHELLSLALKDLKKCEKDDDYKIEMSVWHEPNQGTNIGVCEVCLAGAVMAKTLLEDPYEDKWPNLYPEEIKNKLRAIEDIRTFDIKSAYERIIKVEIVQPEKYQALDSLEYRLREEFKKTFARMVTKPHLCYKEWRKVASELKKANI